MSKLGYFNSVLTDRGVPLTATITVFNQGTATPATIYADAGGVTPLANPFATDAIGRFQFYAATGKYDVQVSGAGITTYKIDNVSLSDISLISELMDVTTYFCITPEQYGAVGDGVTDDWASFSAMFAALAISTAPRKKIILNPAVYYAIKSRKNATNVFEIDIQNLIMEGPGKTKLCLQYEGTATTNLFYCALNMPALKMTDLNISGDNADIGHGGVGAKITNMFNVENMIDISVYQSRFSRASGTAFRGFTWNMFMEQVDVCDMATGFFAGLTLNNFIGCYANGCTIGFNTGFLNRAGDLSIVYHADLAGCACDWADVAYLLNGRSIFLHGSECEGCKQALVAGGSYHGGPHDGPSLRASGCHFNGYAGIGSVGVDDLAFIDLAYGQYTLDALWFSNVATVNTSGAGNPLDSNKQYYLRMVKGNQYHYCITDGTVPKDNIYQAYDYSTEYGAGVQVLARDRQYLRYEAMDASGLSTALTKLCHADLSRDIQIIVNENTDATLPAKTRLFNIGGVNCGQIEIRPYSAHAAPYDHPILSITPGSTHGIELENITVPLVFRYIDFNVLAHGGGYPLFRIRNCRKVSFLNCKFTLAAGQAMKIFDMDMNSELVLDRDTMDLMTGPWTGLCGDFADYYDALYSPGQDVKFIAGASGGWTAAPTAGIWDTGCKVPKTPVAGSYIGYVCTAGGAPGTWKHYGTIGA